MKHKMNVLCSLLGGAYDSLSLFHFVFHYFLISKLLTFVGKAKFICLVGDLT